MSFSPDVTQLRVISDDSPILIVLGGAGTGKTTTAAAAAARFLAQSDLHRERERQEHLTAGRRLAPSPRSRVLFLSFSRTAVAQVLDRAGNVVGPLIDRIEVSTFDAFAWRVICDFGLREEGADAPSIISAANSKVPGAPTGFTYAQLIPAATQLLIVPTVAAHYQSRYGLIICDEFQDTSDLEWRFVQLIAPNARRILLGDINQCIYADMKQLNPERRIADVAALDGAKRIDLPQASHRDPSGVLPAAAEAARSRNFDSEAIRVAVRLGKLRIVRASPESSPEEVIRITRNAVKAGGSVSIFTHTNQASAALSDELRSEGILHEQVGFTEAFGEALLAQLALLEYALHEAQGWRRALAVFVTANTRGSTIPPLAQQILDGSNDAFERALNPVLTELRGALEPKLDYQRIAGIIQGAFERFGTFRGQETWRQAAGKIRIAIRLLSSGGEMSDVNALVERMRNDALVGSTQARPRQIQVMNLHQTKGREADETVLLLQPDEFHGRESEPYHSGSRLLYVVLTRARNVAHIIVPPEVHGLWKPLIEACERAECV